MIGTPLATLTLPVEAGKVAELARSVRAADDPRVPPTFSVTAAHHAPAGASGNELVIEAAGLDRRRVLLGEMAWAYHRPVNVGDVLTGEVSLVSVEERDGRRGGSMRIARGRTAWRDGDGEPVQDVTVTLIEPAAAPLDRRAGPPDDAVGGDLLRLSRTDIVRYAGASGDFNPVHHDEAAARALGYPGVFAMGLLPGGILASRAAATIGVLSRLELRFSGLVWPDVDYRIFTSVVDGGGSRGGVELSIVDGTGATCLRARAYGGG